VAARSTLTLSPRPRTIGPPAERAGRAPAWRGGRRRASLCAFALAVAAVACSGDAPPDSSERSRPLPAVAAYEVTPRDLSRAVQVSGTVEPLVRVRVSTLMAGVLGTLDLEEGDPVVEGQVVAELELTEHRAELARARAELDLVEQRHQRARALAERGLASRAEAADRQRELTIARRAVELWTARLRLGRMTSPIDGVVTRRHVDPGSAVAAHVELLEIADLTRLVVRVALNERDVLGLDPGLVVPTRVDALPDRPLEATIRRVYPTADPDTRRITVELALGEDAVAAGVRPGYLARATLEVDRRRDALAVPTEALLASRGDDRFVYRIVDGVLERRAVVIGVERRSWTQIVDGVEPGDHVVGMNPTNLREGLRVRVARWIE